MRICIYGAASNKIDNKYIEDLEVLGTHLAEEGYDLVFGGGATGMMGAAARGFKKGNGNILGIVPKFISSFEPVYDKCTELIKTETMAERKQIMEDNSDVFLIAPGGIGTMDEFFQCLTLKQLDRHSSPIILYSSFNYYSILDDFITDCIDKKFISKRTKDLYIVCNTYQEVLDVLQQAKMASE